jgi:hypothetical protein
MITIRRLKKKKCLKRVSQSDPKDVGKILKALEIKTALIADDKE